jgi:hypothetical protein
MAREGVSRRPAFRLLEAVQEKPQRGKVLVHLPDLLFASAAYEWETAYFHKVVSVPCVVTLTQKEFGRPASSGEQTRMKTEQNTPRRAPRSRRRNSKLGAAPPNAHGPAWSIRPMQHPVRLLLLSDLACRSASRESGVSSPLIRGAFGVVDRCLASSPTMRHQNASAGCSAGSGRRRSAAASSRRSTPAPASRRVKVRSASHGEVAKQSHVRASAIASAHGSRSRAAGSAAVTHQTRDR